MEIWIDGKPVTRAARATQAAEEFADMLDDESINDPEFNYETNIPESEPNAIHTTYRRHPLKKEHEEMLCAKCGVDTLRIKEHYRVQSHLWETIVPHPMQEKLLCIGCLEIYLGRPLVSTDFREALLNYLPNKSERLLNRLGQWFRDFDEYGHKTYKGKDLSELSDRINGKITRPPFM